MYALTARQPYGARLWNENVDPPHVCTEFPILLGMDFSPYYKGVDQTYGLSMERI